MNTPVSPVDASQVLVSIILCGLVGMMGQGVRVIVGLKNLKPASDQPDQQSVFNAAYLLFSLMIGFIAGIVAGFVTGLSKFQQFNLDDPKILLAIATAGYAGADFIENSMSIVIPSSSRPPSSQAPVVNPTALTNPKVVYIAPTAVPLVDTPVAADPSALLGAALRIAAPKVRTAIWLEPLVAGFQKFDLSNDKRMAAAIGQFLVEAGAAFQEVVEKTGYSSADRIHDVFPGAFPTVESAEPYVDKPEALANRAYADRLGNGDEASGDGYRFRGRGLIQLTGRSEYEEFAKSVDMTADQASTYLETPAGAAMSGCWYLASRHCLPLADAWQISRITLAVNGKAMLGHSERLAYSEAMLKALGGSVA